LIRIFLVNSDTHGSWTATRPPALLAIATEGASPSFTSFSYIVFYNIDFCISFKLK